MRLSESQRSLKRRSRSPTTPKLRVPTILMSKLGMSCEGRTMMRWQMRKKVFKASQCQRTDWAALRWKINGVGKTPEKEVNGSFQEDQVNGVDKEYFWTDSQLVQGYVSNDVQRFHIYVTNRVQRICETTDPQQWRYVENPADHTSRGLTVPGLIYSNWFQDPSFCGKINLRLNKGTPELLVRDPEVKKARKYLSFLVLQIDAIVGITMKLPLIYGVNDCHASAYLGFKSKGNKRLHLFFRWLLFWHPDVDVCLAEAV